MRKHKRATVIAIVAFALALAGAAAGGMVASAGAKAKIVTVSEKEYSIGLSTRKLPPGKVTFVVRDKGKVAHALAIAGPGVKTQTKRIQPGKSASLTVTLRAGSYSLWCPVPGHAALGMKLALKVGGSSGGGTPSSTPSTSTTTPTTTSSGGGGWS